MWVSPPNGRKQCVYPVWQVTDQGWLCVSGETLMENTPASPEGNLKAPEHLCRHCHSWRPQKEQNHKPKHCCVFFVFSFLSPSSDLHSAFIYFSPFYLVNMALKILLHCITPSYRQMNKNIRAKMHNLLMSTKTGHQLDFILIPVLNIRVNNNYDTILSKKT